MYIITISGGGFLQKYKHLHHTDVTAFIHGGNNSELDMIFYYKKCIHFFRSSTSIHTYATTKKGINMKIYH